MAPRVTGIIESTKLALEALEFSWPRSWCCSSVSAGPCWWRPCPCRSSPSAGGGCCTGWMPSGGERAQLLELVHGVHWLHSLDVPSLENLVGRLAPMLVPRAESDVVRQGDEGTFFYIVVSGRADVLVNGYVVGAVSRGDSFGERALLRDVPRMATVRSMSPMHLLALSRENFLAAVAVADLKDGPGALGSPVPEGRHWTKARLVDSLSRVSLLSHVAPQYWGSWQTEVSAKSGLQGRRSSDAGIWGTAFSCSCKDKPLSTPTATRPS
jgi:hypothetical protein